VNSTQRGEDAGRPSARTGLGLLGGTAAIFLAEALILPTGFITAVFLARRLGPADYGLFALASMIIVFVEWCCTAIYSATAVKFISEAGPQWRSVAAAVGRLYLLTGALAAAMLELLAGPLAQLLSEPTMAAHLRLFALDIPIACLSSANINVLLGRGFFRKRAAVSAGRWLSRLLLIILCVEAGFAVAGAIAGTIGASLVELAVSWYLVRPRLFAPSSFPARKLWGFAVPLFLNALCLRLFRLDMFALKALGAAAAQVGFYGAATNLSIPPSLLSASLSPSLLSTLSGLLGEGETERAGQIGGTAMRSVFWLLPFAALAAGSSAEIVRFIYGPTFLPAGPLLSLLIFGAVGMHAVSVANALLTAGHRPGLNLLLTAPLVPLSVAGYLLLIPVLGGLGAALVMAGGACLAGFGSIALVCRVWRVPWPVGDALKCLVCSAAAYGAAVAWPAPGAMVVLKLGVIAGLVAAAFPLLGIFTAQERALARTVWRQLRAVGEQSGAGHATERTGAGE
jgi:O-antigen/teichoic acid export membrane protein